MEGKKVEQYYSPPPKLGKWEGFRLFLYNSETGQFLGRTGASWAKILLFYVLFYAVLCGFFVAMLAVFYQTLDPEAPKWQLNSSLIGTNPGLGFRPMPPESNVESTLIWYKASDEGNFLHWTKELDAFLQEYQKDGASGVDVEQRIHCDYGKPVPAGKVCDVDMSQWGQCTKEKKYGFNKSAPCIFLKLNKIFGWMPNFYNDTKNLPPGMPTDLRDHIKKEESAQSQRLDTVWVSCAGENPADIENMGAIQYIPRRGFPGYYFPFTNTPGYLSPLVAVFFEKPKYGVLINIECKAWAHNIIHDRYERRGSVHFELMVD
ncbi:sodium/potassium-transporting ATPase subunit beta-2-like [Polistes fuscatus]|uniref:sodium/potassium-transporting ATPase subunit beta-2-like n=1 Tax=Polistes canadensis TaxID=91411 RepID=UPI000718E217|nr:PREDICTED: sodium/potassium-transporting ATPase subunit beta-2-like [Polistes canadensis]XP_043487072.1 sodium/potassium-transporting ATPase subunit beta-2-like [Polistes fuscatus]